jgi:inner membrane protein involved in colicin E2 resistance
MVKRLFAIAFIFLCTSVAWLILGATLVARSGASADRLRGRVQSVWGAPHVQTAPYAEYKLPVHYTETVTEDGKLRMIERTRFESHTVRPSASEIAVDLKNEFRQKGLLWYSTYKVGFRGEYALHNPEPQRQSARFYLPLPAAQAVYDDLLLVVDGRTALAITEKEAAYVALDLPPNGTVKVRVSYGSQGLESWRYSFGQEVNPVENFHLRMTTNFRDIDFPDNTLAPAEKHETADGWQLHWTYKNLLSGYAIAMTMPEKLQPGPLASEISFFAPVSLFFFFFLIFIITTLRNVDLHPMNYFFLGAAFFAFHLLLAYLVDHLDIHASFAICSAVSVLLVVTYLRLVVGTQFAIREAALAQIIYLVLFSYAFFFKGMTGLSITVGAILTLFVVMQMTGRIRWSEKFAAFDVRRPGAAPSFPSTN